MISPLTFGNFRQLLRNDSVHGSRPGFGNSETILNLAEPF